MTGSQEALMLQPLCRPERCAILSAINRPELKQVAGPIKGAGSSVLIKMSTFDSPLLLSNANSRAAMARFIDDARHTLLVQHPKYSDVGILDRLLAARGFHWLPGAKLRPGSPRAAAGDRRSAP